MKVKIKSNMIEKKTVIVQKKQIISFFFLDSSTELNVISQCYIVMNKMIKLNVKISDFLFINDHLIYCYDVYFVQYNLKDS